MCGIAGFVRFREPATRSDIEAMTGALAHRGPDGEGVWVEGNVAIGHRRLAIIDLGSGQQPMSNEDGSIWITYNGEIYNFRELQRDLEAKGHRFRTKSDTEVVVHAYEEWGDDCVCRLRGMFAFGIVDRSNRRVFLARDHLGIKPLSYYSDSTRFAFASEIQAFQGLSGARFDLDLRAIDQYLWLQYIPAPLSAYTQVRKLPPAHRMSVGFDGRITGPEKYWRLEFRPDRSRSREEWIGELDHVLRDSVRSHLVSDVPFGAFLSGGIDSSAVVAYMAQELDVPVKTFTIGFEEAEFDETRYASLAAERWKTDHHVEIIKPDAMAILPELVRHYGEPFGDSSAIPTYYVCKMARHRVPMVLSGDGGDESFAGYASYMDWLNYLDAAHDGRPFFRRAILHPLRSKLFPVRYPPPPRHGPFLENWIARIHYIPTPLRRNLWRPEYRHLTALPLDAFEKEREYAQQLSPTHMAQYLDFNTYLPFDILTKIDIASMAHGLEVRTPFVDRKVAEFAATIPDPFNVVRGQEGWTGKRLLKELLRRYYPNDFLDRPKMGFAVPIHRWFSREGELHGMIGERLLGSSSTLLEYFEPDTIRSLINKNVSHALWLLLFLEEWLRQARQAHRQ